MYILTYEAKTQQQFLISNIFTLHMRFKLINKIQLISFRIHI